MAKKKNATIVYVAPIPKDRSGIGTDVPAHVKVEWRDDQDRRNTMLLELSDEQVQRIAQLPDAA